MFILAIILCIALSAVLKGLRHKAFGMHAALLSACVWLVVPQVALSFTVDALVFVVLMHLAIIQVSTFVLYGWDKRKSQRGGWRVPEKTLHAFALSGGTLGAIVAQKTFKHKTRKRAFRSQFWLAVIVHFAILFYAWLLS